MAGAMGFVLKAEASAEGGRRDRILAGAAAALRLLVYLAVALSAASPGRAEEATVTRNVILRGERSLVTVKKGTVVEVVSLGDGTVTVRYNGQVGTVPRDSVTEIEARAAVADGAKSEPDAPPPVTPALVMGTGTFFLAGGPGDSPDMPREYIPDDETLEHWAHRISIRVYKDLTDPMAFLQGMQQEALKYRPPSNSRMLEGEETREPILEFSNYAPSAASQKYRQWNLMRAAYVAGKGVVTYEYSVRYYSYGDATAALIDQEREGMFRPFASASFEEVNNIVKSHNVRLSMITEPTVKSFFPNGVFEFKPRVTIELAGYLAGGIEIPAMLAKDGAIWSMLGAHPYVFDASGVAVPHGVSNSYYPGEIARLTKLTGKGAFKIRAEQDIFYSFELRTGGIYTLVLDCTLKDSEGRQFMVSASQNVTVVDTRAPDRSMDPQFRP